MLRSLAKLEKLVELLSKLANGDISFHPSKPQRSGPREKPLSRGKKRQTAGIERSSFFLNFIPFETHSLILAVRSKQWRKAAQRAAERPVLKSLHIDIIREFRK